MLFIPIQYIFYTVHEFEFDPQKSASNLERHGIDFIDAQTLWNDANLIEIDAKSDDEPRTLVIGKIQEKHWSAVITRRHGRIRIISVRRSRRTEVLIYEG